LQEIDMTGQHKTDVGVSNEADNEPAFMPWLWTVAIALVVAGVPGFSHAANNVGKFTVVAGSVDALREQQDAPIAAKVGMDTFIQDIVRTKHRSCLLYTF